MSRTKYVQTNFLPVFFLSFAVFLAGLASKPVPTIDGAVYASVARNIVETGVWFPNVYMDRLFAEHPPLYVWSIATSMNIFGVNDFGANFPMHFFSFLCVLMTYWISLKSGFPRGAALASATILCASRDFVLSGVRGYIEPLFIFFIYLSLYCVIAQIRKPRFYWPLYSGLALAIAWLSKGPPALWPTLFFPILFFIFDRGWKKKITSVLLFFISIICIGLPFYLYINKTDPKYLFLNHYFYRQIMGSAVEGRNGAQDLDYFYFIRLFWKFYQPWVLLLPLVVWLSVKETWKKYHGMNLPGVNIPGLSASLEKLFQRPLAPWIFLIFAAGFVGGFSLVKWRFWYYVAPAYPAFALAISRTICYPLANIFERPLFSKIITGGSLLWILSMAVFPIKTFRDRVPEITEFKDTINHYPEKLPILFFHTMRDHNLIATSGEWVFHRGVQKVISFDQLFENISSKRSWIILEKNLYIKNSSPGAIIAQSNDSYLILSDPKNLH